MSKGNAPVLIAFLLDRSLSMQKIRDIVIRLFNEFVAEQQREEGSASFILNTFSDECQTVVGPVPIASVQPLGVRTYIPKGDTALLDAIAQTIGQIDVWIAEHGPHPVYLVILTDGEENKSREYRGRRAEVGVMLDERQTAGWQVRFLSSSWEAVQEAEDLRVRHSVHVHGPDDLSQSMSGTSQDLLRFRRRGRPDPDSSGGGGFVN